MSIMHLKEKKFLYLTEEQVFNFSDFFIPLDKNNGKICRDFPHIILLSYASFDAFERKKIPLSDRRTCFQFCRGIAQWNKGENVRWFSV